MPPAFDHGDPLGNGIWTDDPTSFGIENTEWITVYIETLNPENPQFQIPSGDPSFGAASYAEAVVPLLLLEPTTLPEKCEISEFTNK